MFAETTFVILIVPWLSNEQIRSVVVYSVVVVETGGKLPLNRIRLAYSASRGDELNISIYPASIQGNSTDRCGEGYNVDVVSVAQFTHTKFCNFLNVTS